jgi:hypothetical protein
MPSSRRWKYLRSEIENLRVQFLPNPFDPLGVYPEQTKVQAHARAFLVFCHAEFESYLEGLAKDIAKSSENLWTSSTRISVPLQFLLVTRAKRISVPTKIEPGVKDVPQRLSDELTTLFQTFYTDINDNHGIKEHNILSLFGPLGINLGSLGPTLLPNLDSFGERRGDHAHHSVALIVTPLDPETEYMRAINLATDLLGFDNWCSQTKRKIR